MKDARPTFEDWEIEIFMNAFSKTWNSSLDDQLFSVDACLTIPRDVPTKDTLHLNGEAFLAPGFTYRTSKYSADLDSLQILFEDSSGSHSIPFGPLIHKNSSSEPWHWLSAKERVLIPTEIENIWVYISATFRKLDNDSTFSRQFKIKMNRKDEFRLIPPDWLNR